MRLTRRQFAAGSLGALAGLALGGGAVPSRWGAMAQAFQPETKDFFDWKPVADGAWVGFEGGGNSLIIRSGPKCALVDTKNCGWGDTLRREAAALGGEIALIVNTHHHGDHVGGNPSFKKDVPILAHGRAGRRVVNQAEQTMASLARLAKQLEAEPGDIPARAIAEVLATAERAATIQPLDFVSTIPLAHFHEVAVHRLTVRMQHAGAGHTDNDLFVFFPDLNLLHTGDLVFHKLHPYMDVPAGANSRGWQKSLQAMIEICDDKTIVVPGHGDVTNVEGLRGQLAYFDTLRDIVAEARKTEGITREQVSQMQPDELKSFGFERMQANNLSVMFDELEKEADA